MTTKMIALVMETWLKGGAEEVESFRELAEHDLGVIVEHVTMHPFDRSDTFPFSCVWHVEIALLVPPEHQQRCTELAEKLFPKALNVIETGSRIGA